MSGIDSSSAAVSTTGGNRRPVAEQVMARADDDRVDRRRRRRARRTGCRVPRRPRRHAHQHQRSPRPFRERDAMRREDLREQRARLARSRLVLDAHPGLHEVAAVDRFRARPHAGFPAPTRAAGRGSWRPRRPPRAMPAGTRACSRVLGCVAPGSDLHGIAAQLDHQVGGREQASSASVGARCRMSPCRITAVARCSTSVDS